MKIFIYSTFPFLLPPTPCPSTALLINHVYSWKSKLKHTVVDILRAFLKCKIFVKKTRKVFIGSILEPVEHLSWSFLQKKLTVYSQKQFSQKFRP